MPQACFLRTRIGLTCEGKTVKNVILETRSDFALFTGRALTIANSERVPLK